MGRAILWIFGWGLLIGHVHAAGEVPVNPQRLEFIASGFRDAREHLNQFVWTATWEYSSTRGRGGPGTLTSSLKCWCDFPAGRFRFDRKDTIARTVKSPDLFEGVRENRYVRTPEQTIHAPIGIPGVCATVDRPGADSRFETFDVRNVGIAMPQELPLAYEKVLAFFWTQQTLLDISDEEGLARLQFAVGEPARFRRTVWVDEKRGFTPVRFECFQRSGPEEDWGPPRVVMHATWAMTNDVWVPELLESEDAVAGNSTVVKFAWVSVNTRLDDNLFTYDGLGLDQGTTVADVRLGDKPIVVAVVGQSTPPQLRTQPSRSASWVPPFVAACAALAALLGMAVIYRRRALRAGKA